MPDRRSRRSSVTVIRATRLRLVSHATGSGATDRSCVGLRHNRVDRSSRRPTHTRTRPVHRPVSRDPGRSRRALGGGLVARAGAVALTSRGIFSWATNRGSTTFAALEQGLGRESGVITATLPVCDPGGAGGPEASLAEWNSTAFCERRGIAQLHRIRLARRTRVDRRGTSRGRRPSGSTRAATRPGSCRAR